MTELRRLRETERWLAWVRLAAVPFAAFQVAIGSNYPRGYERWAWVLTGGFAAGTLFLFWLSRKEWSFRRQIALGVGALAFDFGIVSGYILVYTFEQGTPIRQIMFLPLIEAGQLLREHRVAPHYFRADYVSLQIGVEILMALIVGWLVSRLRGQTSVAEARAGEAERFRDQLGRRADVLEAANRCARALSSSLELEQAFEAFIREVRGFVPFDRIAIVLSEEGSAQVMAVAGIGAERVLPPGSARPIKGTLLEEILGKGQPVYRKDMLEPEYPEEERFRELGLRSRFVTPLYLGARTIGMLSLVRREPDAFTDEEMELAGLLGRLVASAVQNIRAYEAERKTVEELRRLSALRADFVSLVSHELRTPMAAVIGSARTLQQRWRELTADQRESFLELIAAETGRLATLISDVLDTSRIDAGTFTFRFSDVDLAELVRDSVASAEVSSDEVGLRAEVRDPLPVVRGDPERLRQVLMNLIENAIKYSPAGDQVDVHAYAEATRVRIDVRDRGPGIAREDQRLIFEKFGRVTSGNTRPGTGLGLFIARSIAEAHGGTLEVSSAPEHGAVFTLDLPGQA